MPEDTKKVLETPFPEAKRNFKIWRATSDAKAGFIAMPRGVMMVGSKTNFVAVNNTATYVFGNSIVLGCLSEQLRCGGLFIKMNDFIQCIPSTIVTPGTQMQLPWPPIALPLAIASELPIFVAALA